MVKAVIQHKTDNTTYSARFSSQPEAEIYAANFSDEHYNKSYVDCTAEVNSEIALKFLSDTDWQVIRHRDQLDAGDPTSLTDQEYQQLLLGRQQARDNVI